MAVPAYIQSGPLSFVCDVNGPHLFLQKTQITFTLTTKYSASFAPGSSQAFPAQGSLRTPRGTPTAQCSAEILIFGGS